MSTTVATFAATYEDGDRISYTAVEKPGGAVRFNVDGNAGFCIEVEVAHAESGTGTVDVISSDSRLAKTMYYMVKKGWVDNPNGEDPLIPGFHHYSVCQGMTQVANQGQRAIDSLLDDWEPSVVSTIVDYVEDAQTITVPSNFKVFKVSAGNYQDFVVSYIEEETTGILKLKKASANTDITG